MLSRSHRLRQSKQFRVAYRQGRCYAHPILTVHVLQEGASAAGTDPEGQVLTSPPTQVGFAVSRKVGGAVERNLIRRRLRELVRTQLPFWQTGLRVVVTARPAAAAANWDELSGAFRKLANRVARDFAPVELDHRNQEQPLNVIPTARE